MDGEEISAHLLRGNHIEITQESTEQPGVTKYELRINSLRSSDEGKYKLRVENLHGQAETEPIELQVDRSMRLGENPRLVFIESSR